MKRLCYFSVLCIVCCVCSCSKEGKSYEGFDTTIPAGIVKTKVNDSREDNLRGFNPTPIYTHNGNTFAVIIGGAHDNQNNEMRYWNDCQFMFRTLKQRYLLDDDDIFVLYSGGPSGIWQLKYGEDEYHNNIYYSGINYLDFDLDGIDDIDYAATSTNIDAVFDIIADLVAEGDNLLVFYAGQGGHDSSGSSLCLWGNDSMYPYDMNDQLMKINSEVIINIVLGQSYSGGFIADLSLINTSIATACEESEVAYQKINNPSFDDFVFNWICAMALMTPSGHGVSSVDCNNDGFISMYEAYRYANLYNSYNQIQHPQYYCLTPYFGENHDLIGNYSYVPRLREIGSQVDVSYSHTKTFYVDDCPPGVTPEFFVDGNIELIAYSNNYATIRYTGSLPYDNSSSNCFWASFPTSPQSYTSHIVDCIGWKGGYYNNSSLISLSYGGNPARFTLPSSYDTNINYVWSSSVSSWYPLFQGYYYIYFNTDDIQPLSNDIVTVSFNNPLGEATVISQVIADLGYDDYCQ